MSIVKGPWPPGEGSVTSRTHPAVLATLVAALVLMAGHTAYQALSVDPRPEVAATTPDVGPAGHRSAALLVAGEDIGMGIWQAEPGEGERCGYRKVSSGGQATENTIDGPGTVTFTVRTSTQYVELYGPCVWTWKGAVE